MHDLNPRKGAVKSHSLGSSTGWQLSGQPQNVALPCDYGILSWRNLRETSGLKRGSVASLKKISLPQQENGVRCIRLSFVLWDDLASHWGQDFHLGRRVVRTSQGLPCHCRCRGPMFTLTAQAESCLFLFLFSTVSVDIHFRLHTTFLTFWEMDLEKMKTQSLFLER